MSTCPFEKGHRYRIKRTVEELGHVFVEGEIVEFTDDSYDPKLGVHRFWFRELRSAYLKAWHAWDDNVESVARWCEIFEAL